MNTPLHPSAFSSTLGPEQRLRRQAAGLAAKALATGLVLACLTGTCLATEQPPETAPQQRAWLLSCLVTDMQSVGSFQSGDIARTVTLVNTLTDDQVSLLTRFYYLTRAKAEQDARLYAVQLSDTQEALAQAKAQAADLLTQEQNQIEQTYSELATEIPVARPCARSPTPPSRDGAPTTATPSPTGTTATAATSVPSSRQVTAAHTPCRSTTPSTTTAAVTTTGAAGRTSATTSRESPARMAVQWLREHYTRTPRPGMPWHLP